MGRNGIVATSQPLAAQAGLDILKKGGNAIDAAVAAAAVLSLVEPMNVGIGGDLFAIIYVAKENKLYTLNASGKAPSGQTLAHMNSLGYSWDAMNWGPGSGMPRAGILTVTVPGTVWGWDEVLHRFGSRTFKETLQPAIDYAEQGFPVSERIANDWRLPNALPPVPSNPSKCCTRVDPDSIATWYINGKQPSAGQIYRSPDLAKTFRILQQKGRDGFYQGEVARAIVAKSNALGGTMTLDHLAHYSGEWLSPATTNYHGYDVSTLPPPAQTWATDEMLNILEACVPVWIPGKTLAAIGPSSPQYWHLMVEAKKLAYKDLYTYNADPDFVTVPIARLLSKSYAQSLCGAVDPNRASRSRPGAPVDSSGDTIVLSAADRWGNMVSWVNSNYASFGSGVTVPGYGFILHNRGALFTLDPKSPNAIAPNKRPFNTLSAGFVMQNNRPLMTVTLMGGDMQAQGIAQVLVNVLDLGANLQAATDIARFYHSQVPNVLSLESKLFGLVGGQLQAMGHNVRSTNGGAVGGYQAVMFTPDPGAAGPIDGPIKGFYRAGSDHRKDGQAAAY
jgi:gamma-glutamyltranspeptidase/glutathione hydrolase